MQVKMVAYNSANVIFLFGIQPLLRLDTNLQCAWTRLNHLPRIDGKSFKNQCQTWRTKSSAISKSQNVPGSPVHRPDHWVDSTTRTCAFAQSYQVAVLVSDEGHGPVP